MSYSHLFSFAAKGLQAYIMRGGKLRDMVGATSLIDKLSSKAELEDWLTGPFGLQKEQFDILQAAAGSARIGFRDEGAARTIERLWPLWCHAWAPGLEVVQHLESWGEAGYAQVAKLAADHLERNRNFPAPQMPESGPFAKRAPRTGEAAVKTDHDAEDELIDRATRRKRAERDALKSASQLPPLARAFGFGSVDELPDDFTQVSGTEGAFLAIVHADGNRLGQMFLDVGRELEAHAQEVTDETAMALFRYLSEEVVTEGTRSAVRRATKALGDSITGTLTRNQGPNRQVWPIAPIVLAGDDVTVVCRDDLGLPFTKAFLNAFRDEMEMRLGWLQGKGNYPTDPEKPDRYKPYHGMWSKLPKEVAEVIPTSLSAGAGVVFCTDHYPFSLAYELCESLAKRAKDVAKGPDQNRNDAGAAGGPAKPGTPPSAICFVRITGGSAPTEFEELAEGILRGSDGTLLTGGPYFVDGNRTPQFTCLEKVFSAARPHLERDPLDPTRTFQAGLPTGSLRGLLNSQRTNAELVPEAVNRMKEVTGSAVWAAFETEWKKLCGDHSADWNWLRLGAYFEKFTRSDRKAYDRSPLFDLLTLLAVRDKQADRRLPAENPNPDRDAKT